jgi:cephalosporin hydroxylase
MPGLLTKVIRMPRTALALLKYKLGDLWIALHNALHRPEPAAPFSDLAELREIEQRAQTPTDISDHLPTLFTESLPSNPRLIVELGVRGGESTFVFERVARLCGSHLVSVDIDDCLRASTYPDWVFVQRDDTLFAAEFPEFCRKRGLCPEIDVLFIDTSHLYAHTVEEIRLWLPYLSERGKVFFHDTNLRLIGRRRDGRLLRGMDSQRSVIRAVEEFLGGSLSENQDFVRICRGWLVKHWAICNGLTLLERLEKPIHAKSNEK